MFKCNVCGAEYEIKPDFCDCGNDTFDEIITEIQTENIEYDTNTTPTQTQTIKRKKTFSEQYPMLSRFLGTLDPISVVIFLLCIVLSVSSFFVIKPKENTQNNETPKTEKNITRNVPDINTFWDDTPPKEEKQKVEEKTENKTIIEQIKDIIPKEKETKPTPKTQPVIQKPSNNTTQQTKKTAPKQTTTTKNTNQNKTTQKSSNTQNTNKQTQTTVPKQTTQPATQTQQPQTQQPQTQQPITQTKPTIQISVNQTQNTQEFKTYKDGLRKTLFSKMNLLNVYGDGACVVDFKINSSGKLTNRSFSKQSTNNTLNDEVYKAIMATPTYKTPPSSYNGQTLHFSVKMVNGQFEVSLY